MIAFAIFIYAFFLYLLYKVTPKSGEDSVFGFRKLAFLITAAEIPYLFAVNSNPEVLHPNILSSITNFEEVFLQFLGFKFLFLIGFTITAFHLNIKSAQALSSATTLTKIRTTPALDLQLAILTLGLAILTFVLLLSELGGINYMLLNWATRTEALRGTAVFRVSNLTFGLLSVGFAINYIARKEHPGIIAKAVLFLQISLIFLILLAVGERKNPILLILYAMISWNFRVQPIRLASGKNLMLLVVLMAFSALFPVLREDGAMELFLSDPTTIIVPAFEHWGQIFARLSDLDTSLFVYSYFDGFDKFWYGASWPDLITGLTPATIFPEKPPIDEGTYIYALAHDYHITPPAPFKDLLPVGWPLSRVTGPYVHFGAAGVIFGGLITGHLMRLISNSTLRSRSPSSLLVYTWAMLTGFGLTNAFLFYLAAMLALLLPLHWIYRISERKIARRLRQAEIRGRIRVS